MKAWKPLAIIGGAACVAIVVAAVVRSPAQAVLPPGYTLLPGTISLNPAHIGAVGSQFTQDCASVPLRFQPGPGQVTWHFILPQAVPFDPTPTNVFNTLSVTFQTAGTVNLGSALTDFGPPSNAHAYVVTATDDTLLAGTATIGRDNNAAATRANDAQFNLSHTCASQLPPPSTTTTTAATTTTTAATTTTTAATTTTTAPTTTAASTTTTAPTTTTGSSTTTGPTTTTGSTTSSTAPTTTAAVGPATSSQSSAEPTAVSPLPHTGSNGTSAANVALLALVLGFALVVAARLRTSASGE